MVLGLVSWGVDIRMEVSMPAVVGLAAAKAAAAEYLEAGGRDIGVVIRVLRIGIGRYRVGAWVWVWDVYWMGMRWVWGRCRSSAGVGWVPGALPPPSARPMVGGRPSCLLPTINRARYLCEGMGR